MIPQFKTEAEAWDYFAEQFGKPFRQRGAYCLQWGLCTAISGAIAERDLRRAMDNRLVGWALSHRKCLWDYFWSLTKRGDSQRVKLCRQFARQCRREAKKH